MKTYAFTDSQYMMASEKNRVLKAWERFLKHGCKLEHFTKALYNHLIQHCSFIAHYNRYGFYATYFDGENVDTQKFLDQFDPNKRGMSAEYGMDYWFMSGDYQDINKAMREVMGQYVWALRERFDEQEKIHDLQLAARLASKHGRHIV